MGAKRNLEYMSIWNSYLRWNLGDHSIYEYTVQQKYQYQQQQHKQHNKYHNDDTGNDEEGLQG